MMQNITILNKLPIDTEARIESLNCQGSLRRRFLDLGMIPGTKIKPILKSPSGDPIAYEIRGAVIALRKEDSDQVSIIFS